MGKIQSIESGSDFTITLNANSGSISAGGKGKIGLLQLLDSAGKATLSLGAGGFLPGIFVSTDNNSALLNNQGLFLNGSRDLPALVRLQVNGKKTIELDGSGGNIWLGGNGKDGDLVIFPSAATDTHNLDQASIHLQGQEGDILLKNADCAEEFDLAESASVEPGTVMVLDQEGKLRQSEESYDKKVAGVISGAGDYKPGIVLDRKHSQDNRMPVALMGKVFCRVDAEYSPIEVGDLMTTSATPGHAMKADDPTRAFGAVIGKALRSQKEGRGLLPILIALQ
ncbi:hypothetical protein ACFQZZ_21785 [Nocardia sp. GCM10030253]|uniref:hypothetical protein n=1 Tax=Nocardia sp. GCM10030253 TaxID=3273404 RepID=UPI0036349BAC